MGVALCVVGVLIAVTSLLIATVRMRAQPDRRRRYIAESILERQEPDRDRRQHTRDP